MANFDFMGFHVGDGWDKWFVAHAKKYTKEQVIELCKREYENLFTDEKKPLREPTIDDVTEASVAFRFGANVHEWPDGCYTFVGKGSPGAFPVYVIAFDELGGS